MLRQRTSALAALLLVALLGGAGWWMATRSAEPQQPMGLFTSLPILWGEGGELSDLLRSDAPEHWAKASLARHGRIVPLDTLEGLPPALRQLVIAQPRPLAPGENLALDNWVRGGGRLLLIADPALTMPSPWPVGDPRRPQDIVLLSPILTRWGLELTFDDGQPAGPANVTVAGKSVPVDLPGAWRLLPGSTCQIESEGLLAVCPIGQGRVMALADAELLGAEDDGTRAVALDSLLERAFSGV